MSVIEHLRSLWSNLKAKHPDAILLLRVGDFYEAFGDDAEIVSDVCGVVYCSRKLGDERWPMAGFPAFAKDGYIDDLKEADYRVVVVAGLRQSVTIHEARKEAR